MLPQTIWYVTIVLGNVLAALLLLDLVQAWCRGWRLRTPKDLAVAVFAVLPAAVAGSRLLVPEHWDSISGLLERVSLVTNLTLLGLIVVDVCLSRWQSPQNPKTHFHRHAPNLRMELCFDATGLPGLTGRARYTVNALGVRGPEFPATRERRRILCVG